MEKMNQKERWDTFPWDKKIKNLAAKDGSKSDLKILSENGRHVHSIADGLGDISSGYKIQ